MKLRKIKNDETGSAIPVLVYIFGFLLFGFVYWLVNGVKIALDVFAPSSNLTTLFNMIWTGIIFVYLIFGGLWLIKQYRTSEVFGK